MTTKELLNEINSQLDYQKREHEQRIKQGALFNVFNVLGVERKETRHSAFIAELLNPQGLHGQKDRFLQMFIRNIPCLRSFEFETNCAHVIVEEVIQTDGSNNEEGGRMDIVIHSVNKGIIIENKIYASDQYLQLARYKKYTERYGIDNFVILYLTLSGYEASESSTNNQMKEGIDYFSLSYAKDIDSWLNDCEKTTIGLVNLNIIIKQYHQIVKNLTNMNKQENNNILPILIENKEAVLAIKEQLAEWETQIITLTRDKLKSCLENIARKRSFNLEFDDTYFIFKFQSKEYPNLYFAFTWDGQGANGWYCGITTGYAHNTHHLLPCFKSTSQYWPLGYKYLESPYTFPVTYKNAMYEYCLNILNDDYFLHFSKYIASTLDAMNQELLKCNINEIKDVLESVEEY